MDNIKFSPYAAAAGWRALGFNFGNKKLATTELLQEPIVLNALTAPINDALKAWRVLDGDGYKLERKYRYQDVVHDSILLAKINGSSLVIPITSSDLRSKINPKTVTGFQVVDGAFDDVLGAYKIKGKNGEEISVARENVFEVFSSTGFRTASLRRLGLVGASEVERLAESYSTYKRGVDEIFYLLKRAIVDTRGIKDLADQMEQAVTDEQKIEIISKLKAVHDAANNTDNHTGVVYDLEVEKIERLSIASSLGGIVQAFEQLKNNFIAAVAIPEVKIFGSQVGGIGNNDASTLSIYYDKVEHLLQTIVYDLLVWMDDKIGASFGDFEFGAVRILTEKEKAEIEKIDADIDNIYFNMFDTAIQDGILKRIEKRYGEIDGYEDADTATTD